MTWMIRWTIMTAIVASISVAVAEIAPSPPSPGQTEAPAQAPLVPELIVAGPPVVGGEIVATLAVMAMEEMTHVQIQIELPSGVERTAGELSWSGSLAAGEVRVLEVSVKLLKPGRRQLVGRVTLSTGAAPPTVLTTDRWLEITPAAPAKPRK